MSGLLDQIRKNVNRRRNDRIRIAAYPGDDYCQPGYYPVYNDLIKEWFCQPIPAKPTTPCACGKMYEWRGNLGQWVCVDDPSFPPAPTCEPGFAPHLNASTCQWECLPDPTYVPECPPGMKAEWNETIEEWRCVTDPTYTPPPTPPDPETPDVSFIEWGGNIGENVSDIIGGKGRIENILRTRIQMGNEYGANKGWYTVSFPFEMLNPRVIAISGPRSAKEPIAQIRFATRADYVAKFGQNIAYELLHPIQDAIPTDPFGIENWIFNEILYPLVTSFGTFIGELTYDVVVKPQMELLERSIKATIPILPEMWGLGRERSVHQVVIRRITTTSFEWYSYGNMYINWIAIGTCTEAETPLPPEIQEIINRLDQWDEETAQLREFIEKIEARVQEIVDQIGGVQPTKLPKRRFKLFGD